ncbi:MAG: hypothetical protein E7173_01405 [Firmicutes bacterium]|nr:hypothetical protein [Bacillota bacterium]
MNSNEKFDQYIEAYKTLPLQEKKKMVNEEVKKLLAFIDKAKRDLNITDDILFNREILDLNNEFVSDDDFVEAMFVYVHAIQESLGKYFNEVSKILYK